ncbi:MAG TPA: NAD-dependent epimerase/dehydratase family protein [Patescibacteria group bacterium]
MKYKNILITGGAGFVGSNLAIKFKNKYQNINVTALDNLKRRGSELNLNRLRQAGVKFIHGDIRNNEDFEEAGETDLIFECSAEPSVMAGINSSPAYLINTNLNGTINCLEFARKTKADFVFISTSRVYPIERINELNYSETENRFILEDTQKVPGATSMGIAENFPLDGARSLYGTTKLSSEMLLQEYIYNFGIKGFIDRCGVITGPWQMGKFDQGVFVLWAARHIYGGKLAYIGYGGEGKQVRDFMHIDDLFELLDIQINDMNKYNSGIFNTGGGLKNSVSLKELTKVCQEITGKKINIESVKETRSADLKLYISNYEKIKKLSGWEPKRDINKTISDISDWIEENKESLRPILN